MSQEAATHSGTIWWTPPHRFEAVETLIARGKYSKNKQEVEPQWMEWNGKRIFEVII